MQTTAGLEALNGPALITTCSNTHPCSTIGAGQHVVSRPCRSLNRDGFSTNLHPWRSRTRQSRRLRLATALDALSAEHECGLLTLSQISCRGTKSGILSVRDASTPRPRRSNSGSRSRSGHGRFQKQKAMDGALMGRKSLIVVCAAYLLGSGGGCTSTSLSDDGPPQGPAPNYRAIIAKGLIEKAEPNPMTGASYFADQAGLFLPDKKLGQIEISDAVRMVQTNTNGWAWQTCMRLSVDSNPGTYAVFIADGRAVLARAANPTDNCGAGQYAPLDVRQYNPVKRDARTIRQ